MKINFHRVLLGFFENWDKLPQKKWASRPKVNELSESKPSDCLKVLTDWFCLVWILAVEEFGIATFLSGLFMFSRNRSDFGTMLVLPVVRLEIFGLPR